MKSRISALMDGELARHEVDGTLDRLRAEGDARDTWRAYHLIGDSIRDTRMLSAGFAARVAAKLSKEPAVLAPPPRRRQAAQAPVWALAAAASLAFANSSLHPETPGQAGSRRDARPGSLPQSAHRRSRRSGSGASMPATTNRERRLEERNRSATQWRVTALPRKGSRAANSPLAKPHSASPDGRNSMVRGERRARKSARSQAAAAPRAKLRPAIAPPVQSFMTVRKQAAAATCTTRIIAANRIEGDSSSRTG